MTEKRRFNTELKKIAKIIKPLSTISLEDKIKKLQDLKKRKKDIESELQNIGVTIIYLEDMPDIARYYVSKNEFAINLLSYLKNNDGIAYTELRSSLPDDSLSDKILNFGLDLLIRAQLIEKQPSCSNVQDYLIKLTNYSKGLTKK